MRPVNHAAIRVIAFYMKFPGFWPMESERGQRYMKFSLINAIILTTMSCTTSLEMFIHNTDNFRDLIFALTHLAIAVMGLYKLMLFTYKRPTFLEFMEFFNKNFWMKKYENHGERIMGDSMKKCLFYVVSIVIVCHLSLSLNFIKPLIENRGKNESGRELPFPWYMSFPAHPQLTPAYEILFAMQMVAVFYVCLCYFSFDIFLCGINLTLVGEFSILQEDLEAVCDFDEVLDDSLRNRSCIYSQFAKCVNQHQILMYSADVLKDLYKNIVASFVVILSILICLAMYQVMTIRDDIMALIHACAYVVNILTELYFFTVSCDDLSDASTGVAQAAYNVPWFTIESLAIKEKLMHGLRLVMVKSQKPSQMTVGDFSPVTLQTLTSICNLAFSFLALIRQRT